MIARLFVILPFSLTLPDGEKFSLYKYTDNKYDIIIYPPMKSGLEKVCEVDNIKINNKTAFTANILRVDFYKDNFQRHENCPCDPPEELINKAVNSFIIRLRFVTKGNQIKPINFPFCSWKINYLTRIIHKRENAIGDIG